MNSSSLQQEQLRTIVARFIQQLYEASGSAIRHVTVTLHSDPDQLSADSRVHAISVRKTSGTATLCYQELNVDTPIATTLTLVATDK